MCRAPTATLGTHLCPPRRVRVIVIIIIHSGARCDAFEFSRNTLLFRKSHALSIFEKINNRYLFNRSFVGARHDERNRHVHKSSAMFILRFRFSECFLDNVILLTLFYVRILGARDLVIRAM